MEDIKTIGAERYLKNTNPIVNGIQAADYWIVPPEHNERNPSLPTLQTLRVYKRQIDNEIIPGDDGWPYTDPNPGVDNNGNPNPVVHVPPPGADVYPVGHPRAGQAVDPQQMTAAEISLWMKLLGSSYKHNQSSSEIFDAKVVQIKGLLEAYFSSDAMKEMKPILATRNTRDLWIFIRGKIVDVNDPIFAQDLRKAFDIIDIGLTEAFSDYMERKGYICENLSDINRAISNQDWQDHWVLTLGASTGYSGDYSDTIKELMRHPGLSKLETNTLILQAEKAILRISKGHNKYIPGEGRVHQFDSSTWKPYDADIVKGVVKYNKTKKDNFHTTTHFISKDSILAIQAAAAQLETSSGKKRSAGGGAGGGTTGGGTTCAGCHRKGHNIVNCKSTKPCFNPECKGWKHSGGKCDQGAKMREWERKYNKIFGNPLAKGTSALIASSSASASAPSLPAALAPEASARHLDTRVILSEHARLALANERLHRQLREAKAANIAQAAAFAAQAAAASQPHASSAHIDANEDYSVDPELY